MWERWNGDRMIGDPGMNSFNHYAYGAVGEWIYRYAAGVDATASDPGFHTILLRPIFDRRLGAVDFSYDSRYGTIHSAWTIIGNQIKWKITIPANTAARVLIPSSDKRSYSINGRPMATSPLVKHLVTEGPLRAYQLAAGSYTINVQAS